MTPVTPTKKANPRNYVNNADFLIEISKSKEQGKMTDKLGRMLLLLVQRYSKKASFAGYSYIEDMKSVALVNLCKGWAGFDETQFVNPFGYYSISIKRSFIQVLNLEKKHRDGRDRILVDCGMAPSHSYEWNLNHSGDSLASCHSDDDEHSFDIYDTTHIDTILDGDESWGEPDMTTPDDMNELPESYEQMANEL